MISKEDYHQVFEETVMSVVEGLVNLSDKADITDLKQILTKWCVYYEQKKTPSNKKYTASQASPKSCRTCSDKDRCSEFIEYGKGTACEEYKEA